MKKLLGIVVLGLLLSGNAYAQKLVYNCSFDSAYSGSSNYSKIDYIVNAKNKYFEINYIYNGKDYIISSSNGRLQYFKISGSVITYEIEGLNQRYSFNFSKDNFIDQPVNVSERKPETIISCAKNTLLSEKPKKKKPKASPDDDKIVPAGSGSGFFVSKDGHAITNYHVIEGCDINKLSFKGSQTEVKVLAVDKVNDIAILKSNAKPDVIFPVSNEDVSLLEDVIVAGFPLGKQISSAIKTHKGVVTALAGAGDNYSFFQTDAAINQGNSGGPIINQKGNVVGIAVATWVEEGVQGVHFGIKSSTLKTFASANGLNFASPNYRDLSNKDLGKLITKGTIYVECHMTVAKIKKMIAQAENRKAFFKEHR